MIVSETKPSIVKLAISEGKTKIVLHLVGTEIEEILGMFPLSIAANNVVANQKPKRAYKKRTQNPEAAAPAE